MMEDEIDWNNLFDFSTDLWDPASDTVEALSNPSSDTSVSSWAAEIETLLMNDNIDDGFDHGQQSLDDFFADVLVDSPPSVVPDVATDKDSNVSGDSGGGDGDRDVTASPEEEKSPESNNNNDNDDNDDADDPNNNNINDADDPISRKRRRQLRNRDAAVRSRERKKMYVKDLEMKSRYLEGECRKLGRLLQCVVAENQALRLSLQKGGAFGASSAKQESAVLLLESLLLGSLLWFLGTMCLFTLPTTIRSILESVPLENVEEKAPGNVAQRRPGSNKFLIYGEVKPRRCKTSRTEMKMGHDAIIVLA